MEARVTYLICVPDNGKKVNGIYRRSKHKLDVTALLSEYICSIVLFAVSVSLL